jgi:hypothetical protein
LEHASVIGSGNGEPALMLGDNMFVVLNTIVPSSVLKKKHNAIAYHRVRGEGKIMRFAKNVSDFLAKSLSNEKFDYLMKRWLFCVPETNNDKS